MDAVRLGVVISVASAELVAEWRAVAVRPRVLRYIRKSPDETLGAIAALETLSTILAPGRASILPPDLKDTHLWDLLHSDSTSVLVTGDGPLLTAPFGPGRVITPREAVGRLGKAAPG